MDMLSGHEDCHATATLFRLWRSRRPVEPSDRMPLWELFDAVRKGPNIRARRSIGTTHEESPCQQHKPKVIHSQESSLGMEDIQSFPTSVVSALRFLRYDILYLGTTTRPCL